MLVDMNTLKTPLIVTGLFVFSCLMPVIPILIMYFDGGLLALVDKLLFDGKTVRTDITNWIVNFSLSVLFLVLFYKTSIIAGEIIFSVLALIFLFGFLVFLTGDKYGETNPNFLYFLIISLFSGLILCATAIVKKLEQS